MEGGTHTLQDLRNRFLNELRLIVAGFADSDILYSKISILLEDYELSERTTRIIPASNANLELVKLYTSSLLVGGKAASTIRLYVYELKKFIAAIQKDAKEVNSFEIRSYLAKRKLEGISNRTLDTVRIVIASFYNWLTEEEIIPKNPCAVVKPIKYIREEKQPFSSVELDRLRSACKNVKERSILEFLLSSGIRVSELCDLDIQDINFMTGSVHIKHGKGDKERHTYLTELAIEHLVAYLNGRMKGPVFLPQRGERYAVGGIRYLMRELGKRSGVTNVHPHRFRRTFATQLAARGMQLHEIQKLMGHANINTTMIYVALSDVGMQYAYKKHSE